MQSRIVLPEAGGALRSGGVRRPYMGNRAREHAPGVPQRAEADPNDEAEPGLSRR
jgi:hypothetical protein